MRRSANKLCAEIHYERCVKCLPGIKFTELAAQPVSRSEENKVISGNPFLENMCIMEQNLISHIWCYIQMRNIIIQIRALYSRLVTLSGNHVMRTSNIAICVAPNPRHLSLHYNCHYPSRPLHRLLPSFRAFFSFKKQCCQTR